MRGAIGLSGTYRNTSRVAAVLVCVINAVSYIALDSLNMLGCVTFTLIVKLLVFHFNYLFSLFCPVAVLLLTKTEKIYRLYGERIRNVALYYRRSAPINL